MDMLWREFVAHFVPQLHATNKWLLQKRNLQTGDVVVCLDDKRAGRWPLARVVHVTPGPDGLVRSAVIKEGHHLKTRSLHHLMLLQPADGEADTD